MYTIKFSNGREQTGIESYEAVKALIRKEYPEAVIGHDGDLRGGGESTMFWPSEDEQDDGTSAAGSIYQETLSISHLDTRVRSTASLRELHETLILGKNEMNAQDWSHYDCTGLPTFGGETPADCHLVWSWDTDSLLVGESIEDWRIVSRQEWDARD